MKKQSFKIALFSTLIASISLTSCDSENEANPDNGKGDDSRWITLTGAFPDATGTAGNGGTRAYSITPENAANPSYEVDIFKREGEKFVNSFELKSQRTARVQASEDGKFLYNIQYTGTDGGVFNKYKVSGEGKYEEDGYELNTSTILGTSPRWTKAAEGIGVGVSFGDALPLYTGSAPNYEFQHPKGKITIANIDLNTTAITNTGSVNVDLGDLEKEGYAVWRADVPVLNQAKDKVFIGLGIRQYDTRPTAKATIATNQTTGVTTVSWPQRVAADRTLGTATLVLDYPSLKNPKYLYSTKAKTDNLSYRTMTQYVGSDGHIYQAATSMGSGSQILRISKSSNDYDNTYDFNLNTALGISDAGIRAFRYVKDGVAVVLYTRSTTPGGFIALVNLNDNSATKISTDIETEAGLSTTLSQYQNIGVVGDNVYIPLTSSGLEGNIYVINYKTKAVTKGAKLKNMTGSFYLGAY
jgi:hypothetical protein